MRNYELKAVPRKSIQFSTNSFSKARMSETLHKFSLTRSSSKFASMPQLTSNMMIEG